VRHILSADPVEGAVSAMMLPLSDLTPLGP